MDDCFTFLADAVGKYKVYNWPSWNSILRYSVNLHAVCVDPFGTLILHLRGLVFIYANAVWFAGVSNYCRTWQFLAARRRWRCIGHVRKWRADERRRAIDTLSKSTEHCGTIWCRSIHKNKTLQCRFDDVRDVNRQQCNRACKLLTTIYLAFTFDRSFASSGVTGVY